MSYGWAGRIARADLGSGRCWVERFPSGFQRQWLGGRGLGVALLQQYAGRDVCADDLPLVFAGGPVCGTGIPTASRCVLTGRSPLTGTIFSNSSGGPFARQLRQAGLDALVVTGASKVPVIVTITPSDISLQPAEKLWGLTIDALFHQLSDRMAVAGIGPAGENGVLFASVETSGGEPFARGGMGAVMGRRKLKAVTVSAGDDTTDIADQQAFDTSLQDVRRLFLASPFLYGPFGVREYGSTALVDLLARRRMLPAANFTAELNTHGLNAAALRQRYTPGGYGCCDCPVACKRLTADGLALPEYDALAALAGCCVQPDLDSVVAASRTCTHLGLDPVSAAGSMAAWSEITGTAVGVELQRTLLAKTARRAEEGQLLALGAERLANELGAPTAAMTVKGLELPPYDPRMACGLALAYGVSTHGGTHLNAWPLASEVLRKPVPTDPATFDGKARIIALAETGNAAMDSLVLCRFASCAVELEECAALVAAVTGENYGPGDLVSVGEQIVAAERSFNTANGFGSDDDRLPERFFSLSAGGQAPLDRHRFEQELARYHRICRSGQPL